MRAHTMDYNEAHSYRLLARSPRGTVYTEEFIQQFF
jgi:hypothetical protein